MLNDYEDETKLKQYVVTVNDPDHPSMLTRYFTLYSLLPDLKDQIVLDMPSGQGHKARRFITQSGAKKVIAVDVIKKQLELSRKADLEAGIKPSMCFMTQSSRSCLLPPLLTIVSACTSSALRRTTLSCWGCVNASSLT